MTILEGLAIGGAVSLTAWIALEVLARGLWWLFVKLPRRKHGG